MSSAQIRLPTPGSVFTLKFNKTAIHSGQSIHWRIWGHRGGDPISVQFFFIFIQSWVKSGQKFGLGNRGSTIDILHKFFLIFTAVISTLFQFGTGEKDTNQKRCVFLPKILVDPRGVLGTRLLSVLFFRCCAVSG